MNVHHLGLILATGALGVGGLIIGRSLATDTQRGTHDRVDAGNLTSVATGTSPRRIFATGVVEGTQRDVALRFEHPGRIETIHVREGDAIRKGDILAELDSRTVQQRIAEADARLQLARVQRERLVNAARAETIEVLKADVKIAEVHVQEAESHYTRAKQLAESKSISRQELDDNQFKSSRAMAQLLAARAKLAEVEAPARRDDLQIADAQIALAEANLRYEQSVLDQTRLRAPTDGVVLKVHVETGELVGPQDDRALITVTNRDRTRVRAFVEELDSLGVAPGQSAYVVVDGRPGRRYAGLICSCAPHVSAKNQRHHKPGEFVDVKVREIILELDEASDLVVGLPVDVYVNPISDAP